MNFDNDSLSLLTETTASGKLQFKSAKTGAIYDAEPHHTLLAGEEIGRIHSSSKYHNTLLATPYDPINPRVRIAEGCSECKRKVVSYQRLGDAKKVYYICLCGNRWQT
jgi:DNA-directed RNA polymerase subunit M/transcription elongation factor TFIIS